MKKVFGTLVVLLAVGCTAATGDLQGEADAFLLSYTDMYQKLSFTAAEAEWASNTKIVEGDTTNAYQARMANEALAAFTGSVENIEGARKFLKNRGDLTDLQVKQLETVLYMAANNPQTVPELVKARIKAETELNEQLFGYDFKIDGESVSTSDIDGILRESSDLAQRRQAWETSKGVGASLKDGLADLQRLRNETVQALGYDDYFAYQVSDYGMTTDELRALMLKLNRELRPLFRELHTYARYELAERYGASDVPDMIPADWLPNRWGQDWNALVEVEGLDLNAVLEKKSAEWVNEQGERFFVSLGFDKLPGSFWTKSSLYPLPDGADYKKNNHASAWHMDLEDDVRCLMSVIPDVDWYETVHHEYGHIYYYMEYTNPDVPPLLREGANRAYHEGFGSLLGLAAMQKPFLAHLDLLPANSESDETQKLLKEALNYAVFIPWSAGVMTEFEYQLYSTNLPKNKFNKAWWDLKGKYQGIGQPMARGEEFCDAASKTHIINDAAQYYDYALSYVFLFQVHDHIAKKILKQDPHATNYYGSKEVGKFLSAMMQPGGTRDWQELFRENIGSDLSAKPMLDYFEPLMAYLKQVNAGRTHTLADL